MARFFVVVGVRDEGRVQHQLQSALPTRSSDIGVTFDTFLNRSDGSPARARPGRRSGVAKSCEKTTAMLVAANLKRAPLSKVIPVNQRRGRSAGSGWQAAI